MGLHVSTVQGVSSDTQAAVHFCFPLIVTVIPNLSVTLSFGSFYLLHTSGTGGQRNGRFVDLSKAPQLTTCLQF